MKKFLIAFLFNSMSINFVFAYCGTSYCYDDCENRYVRVEGNECESFGVWIPDLGCRKARGYCNESSRPCHEKTTCYDYCLKDYVRSTGDSCSRYYDYENSCWASIGVCTGF